LEVRNALGQTLLQAEALPYPDEHLYRVDGSAPMELQFVGLVPTLTNGIDALVELAERLKSLRGSSQWLESTRARPGRIVRTIGAIPRQLDADGANAAEILVARPDILEDVAAWYSREEIKRELRVESVGRREYRVLLDNPSHPERRVDLSDTGEGMSQVLPVLVGLELVRRMPTYSVLAVEDPEAHLHEDARRALATRFCDVAQQDRPPILLLETHSRTFLLGVQIAIAAGRIPPDRVTVYWVDQDSNGSSEIIPVSFTRTGAPNSSILQGELAGDLALARELVSLQANQVP